MYNDHVLSCEKQECVWMSWVLREFFFSYFSYQLMLTYQFTDVPISEKTLKCAKVILFSLF